MDGWRNSNKLIPGPALGQNPGYFVHFSPQIQTHGASSAKVVT